MATPDQIAALRLLIGEPTEDSFTDAQLSAIIDAASGDMNKSAYEVWVTKAASAANLVDITEGGSSRKQSDLQDQALAMVRFFGDKVDGGVGPDAPRSPRIHKLSRP